MHELERETLQVAIYRGHLRTKIVSALRRLPLLRLALGILPSQLQHTLRKYLFLPGGGLVIKVSSQARNIPSATSNASTLPIAHMEHALGCECLLRRILHLYVCSRVHSSHSSLTALLPGFVPFQHMCTCTFATEYFARSVC